MKTTFKLTEQISKLNLGMKLTHLVHNELEIGKRCVWDLFYILGTKISNRVKYIWGYSHTYLD